MRPPTGDGDPARLLATTYSASAGDYARLWAPVIGPMGQRLLSALPLGGAAAILDVGAGSGALLSAIRDAAPGARVIGIDRAPGMLAVARAGFPATPLAVMDAQQLGFRSSTFDAAILAFVLFHLPDPLRGLSDVARVLRPGGLAALTTWGANHVLPAVEIWDAELDAAGAKPEVLPDAVQQHASMDAPAKLGGLLEAAGLTPWRLWAERFERGFSWQELLALRSGFGIHRRRLATLGEDERTRCLERIRERAMRVSPRDLVWRPEVICAVARRW
jgi:SAM-dependent methyltransferase